MSYLNKILKYTCISILASLSLEAVSLKQGIQQVLETNPEVIAEQKNQEAFKKYVDERRANYYPRIDIDGRLEKSNSDKNYDTPNSGNFQDGSEQEDGYNFGIALNQMLYDGDLTPSRVREATYNDLANKFRTEQNIDNVVLSAITSYIELIQYKELLELTKSMIKTNEENLQIAKEKEAISGEVLETYQVESKLNFVKEKYIEEKDLKSSKVSTFKRYFGIEPTGNECRPIIDFSRIPVSLQQLVENGVLKNYEIQEQIERIKAQREKIAQADSKFLPNLNLELKALTDSDLSLNEQGVENQAFGRINLTWNLYNGGGDYAVSKQEELFLAEQKERLDSITNKVVESIKVTFQRFNKNKERIEVLKNYVMANENIVEVYKSEFESGTRTFVDILDAQTVLYEAKKSLINREYELYSNYYDILNITSILKDVALDDKNSGCSEIKALDTIVSVQKKASMEDTTLNELSALLGEEPLAVEEELKEVQEIKVEEPNNLTNESEEKKLLSKEFLDAPRGKYTINITTTNGLSLAENFVSENNLESSNAYVYQFGPEMQSAKVIYGIFDSIKEASEAIKTLPSSVLGHKPYVDNITKHQNLYLKYNK